MGAAIAGAVVGALTGGVETYMQYKTNRQNKKLADRQYEAAKQAYQNEEQERAKANQREVDIESLIDADTIDNYAPTDLTGGKDDTRTKLFKRSNLLGNTADGSGVNGFV